MNGHDYEGIMAYGPQDEDEARAAQMDAMWAEWEAMHEAMADEHDAEQQPAPQVLDDAKATDDYLYLRWFR